MNLSISKEKNKATGVLFIQQKDPQINDPSYQTPPHGVPVAPAPRTEFSRRTLLDFNMYSLSGCCTVMQCEEVVNSSSFGVW